MTCSNIRGAYRVYIVEMYVTCRIQCDLPIPKKYISEVKIKSCKI
jgi:hypothetical protein